MKLIKPAVYSNPIEVAYEGPKEKGGGWVKLEDLEITAENFGMEPQEVWDFLKEMGKTNGGLSYSFNGKEIFKAREEQERRGKKMFISEADVEQFLFLVSSGVCGFREKEKGGGYEYKWRS